MNSEEYKMMNRDYDRIPKTDSVNGSQHLSARMRLPTVADAMTFSPFTSIVPFNPAIIPPPRARPTICSPAFASETKKTRHLLEELSAGAANAEQASRRCQQTLNDVQRLLDPVNLPQILFKHPKQTSEDNISLSQKKSRPQALSPFAKMVFDSVVAPYRYLTPVSPGLQDTVQIKLTQSAEPSSRQSILSTPQSHGKIAAEIASDNAISQPSQNVLPPTMFQGSARVVIMNTLTPDERAQYKMVIDHQSLHENRGEPLSNRHASHNITNDQRQKGDVAVSALQGCLDDIFRAEEGLLSNTSQKLASHTNQFLDTGEFESSSLITLQPQIQSQLDKLLLKVFKLNRGADLEMEDLLHVQKLCQQAIEAMDMTTLRIEANWVEADMSAWQSRIVSGERGIVAARTLVRVMTANLQIKELQSEDHLRLILSTFKAIMKECIVPLAEERSTSKEKNPGEKSVPSGNQIFITAVSNRQALQSLLNALASTFRVLGDFLTKAHVDEMDLSSIETVCQALIFAENATNDKDSVFGTQKFEILRRCAMDILAQIFAKYHDQRRDILNTVLTSLGDLPATRQSARQYRLNDGKPIQLVSALLMRLVQTSAIHGNDSVKQKSKPAVDGASEDDGVDDESDSDAGPNEQPRKSTQPPDLALSLSSITKPLLESVKSVAGHVASHLVTRALTTSKSGEDPHRRLLDIFTEDFLNVLGAPDWPAADVILRNLASHMLGLIRDSKSTVPSRALALEMIGTIAAGVLQLRLAAESMAKSVEPHGPPVLQKLADLVERIEAGDSKRTEVLAFDGPYMVLIESLRKRGLDDAQLKSAHGCHLMQWASEISAGNHIAVDSSGHNQVEVKGSHDKIINMLLDADQAEGACGTPDSVTDGKLASMIVALNSPLGKAFPAMFQTLLHQMSSEAATIKSRSLKSVELILDTDPSVLDRETQIMSYIRKCMSDSSSLVRDSALLLTTKCTAVRGSLDASAYEMVVAQTNDPVPIVKKRAIRLAKDIYVRNNASKLHSAIATAIILRILDTESGVGDLAQQAIEEMWFLPLHPKKLDDGRAIEAQTQFKSLVVLLVHIVDSLGSDGYMLETALKRILSSSKLSQGNVKVARALVGLLSEAVIDSSHLEGSPSQQMVLQCLTVFVKADATLFTATQLERLEPYTQNVTKVDGLEVFFCAVTIYRYSLPHQTLIKQGILEKLRISLLSVIPKLTHMKTGVSEVVGCISTIDELLGSTERVAKWCLSVLKNIASMRALNLGADSASAMKLARLMVIAGKVGRAYDFKEQLSLFKDEFPNYRFDSIQELVIVIVSPFTSPKHPRKVRQEALEAISEVSQAWPKGFERKDVINAFKMAFQERNSEIEESVLAGLEEFFCGSGDKTQEQEDIQLGAGIATGAERLGRTYVAADKDRASSHLSQTFLATIVEIALGSCNVAACTAAKLVISFISQSLVMPKEAPPKLIALETSPAPTIAKLAFTEHKIQHSKHESSWDKEYTRAVQTVFDYQCKAVGHSAGYIGSPPVAKLQMLWDTLKGGKAQIRKKFLRNMAQKLMFDFNRLDLTEKIPIHVVFVKFCSENLAFFDYDKVDDVQHLLVELEKTFSTSGTATAQAVESDILQIRVGSPITANLASNADDVQGISSVATPVDTARLYQLAVSSQICLLVWEARSFLRRVWNMQKHKPKKAAARDGIKATAPTRATNASSLIDAYIKRVEHIMQGLSTADAQHSICRVFLETISVDSEVRVNAGSEDDDSSIVDVEAGYETPSGESSGKSPSMTPGNGQRGKKRKSFGGSAGGTPRKKGKKPGMGKWKRSGSVTGAFVDDDAEGEWE
nr:protein rad9 [Quercus suber]